MSRTAQKLERYDEREFVQHMNYINIDISTVTSEQDLINKMRKAKTPTGSRFARPQTAQLRASLVNIWKKRINPLRKRATEIEVQQKLTKERDGDVRLDVDKDITFKNPKKRKV